MGMNLKRELSDELSNILFYWIKNTLDKKNGGFVGEITFDNTIIFDADKGAVLNARILWTFSSAYRFDPSPEYFKIAEIAYKYLVDYFWDRPYGGLYWRLDSLGNPINTRKQIYAQGFGVYAFSEFYRATKKEEALDYAKALYQLIEKHSFDPEYGGYVEALSREWKPMLDMRLSDKDKNEPKSMNTHLHLLEPYTNLYRIWRNDGLANQIRGLIRTFLDKIIDNERAQFNLFFEMDWKQKSRVVSFGHDIEGSWLLHEAAEVLGDKTLLHEVETIILRMVDKVLEQGIDTDGGVLNEYDPEHNHLDSDRHWWPQAEALVGFMNAYQLTRNEKYLRQVEKTWVFIKNNIIDKKNGEWFWKVKKDGTVVKEDCKVGFWKCPYHNSRALIEVLERLEKISK